jgi:hypothetical protein
MMKSCAMSTNMLCVAVSGVRLKMNGDSASVYDGVEMISSIVGNSHHGESDIFTGRGKFMIGGCA